MDAFALPPGGFPCLFQCTPKDATIYTNPFLNGHNRPLLIQSISKLSLGMVAKTIPKWSILLSFIGSSAPYTIDHGLVIETCNFYSIIIHDDHSNP